MMHQVFYTVVSSVIVLWLLALVGLLPPVAQRLRFPLGQVALIAGSLLLAGYLAWDWVMLQRPPMRTLYETFLWCAFFLPLIGLIGGRLWRAPHTILVTLP